MEGAEILEQCIGSYQLVTHLLLKEDDIVGIPETDEVKDIKPLNDCVLIKVAEAEQKTAGGLFLTEASKDKPSFGTVSGL
ncbi:hypothetical protein IFM89_025707 [Coptis chinensis]|uniref:Uncharacterized protein n=1 Tax=Coptis chinensis TaxID=261450 RepID=A0A835I6A7_9MAGN|nr:hypothetical protein IFM89_025707 [Coptis chinensis]